MKLFKSIIQLMVLSCLATAAMAYQPAKGSYVYVLFAKKTTVSHSMKQSGAYDVVLHKPSMSYLSAPPNRQAGHITVREFTQLWGKGKNSFKSDHPNASLMLNNGSQLKYSVILSQPMYDRKAKAFRFMVKTIHGNAIKTGTYGSSAIYIDDFSNAGRFGF